MFIQEKNIERLLHLGWHSEYIYIEQIQMDNIVVEET